METTPLWDASRPPGSRAGMQSSILFPGEKVLTHLITNMCLKPLWPPWGTFLRLHSHLGCFHPSSPSVSSHPSRAVRFIFNESSSLFWLCLLSLCISPNRLLLSICFSRNPTDTGLMRYFSWEFLGRELSLVPWWEGRALLSPLVPPDRWGRLREQRSTSGPTAW